MTYDELVDFISNRMRMSHIYQPVMLIALLENGGVCHESVIAKEILIHDQSQVEYYTRITNNMVGRVLRNHKIVERERSTKNYHLNGYEELSPTQVSVLIYLCQQRLHTYIQSRGERIFEHRRKTSGYISGSIKYQVLKRSKFHCELCGISADEKALEVDHIIPRNLGGSDDISNLQALCYSCNAMKRDRDSTDLRQVRESYSIRDTECPFCSMDSSNIVASNELAVVVRDGFPVTDLHSLIIPKRHVKDFFDLGQAEVNACTQLLNQSKDEIEELDQSVSGFNIGTNNGESAGQTIFHCHIHLIPRRDEDVDDPSGGVRHTIPGKGYY